MTENLFPVVSIEGGHLVDEPIGTKPKTWLRTPAGPDRLFKESRSDAGDDWAEKVSEQIAQRLGIPHAHYELATYGDRRGVVSETFVPKGCRLVHGNELLAAVHPDGQYPEKKKYRVKQHTLRIVLQITRSLGVPPDSPPWAKELGASALFSSYLLLDALISNQDRHHLNWGVISEPGSSVAWLAPTFDHASSLACNVQDETKSARLESSDVRYQVPFFVTRAKSRLYHSPESPKPLGTLEAAEKAFARLPADAREFWAGHLECLNRECFNEILSRVPGERITSVSRIFAEEILVENLRRLKESLAR